PSATGARRLLLGGAAVAVAEALLELLDATFGVDEALLAGEERVVAGPHVDVQLGLRAVGLHDDLAVADDLAGHHLGVDVLLHRLRPRAAPRPGHLKPSDSSTNAARSATHARPARARRRGYGSGLLLGAQLALDAPHDRAHAAQAQGRDQLGQPHLL